MGTAATVAAAATAATAATVASELDLGGRRVPAPAAALVAGSLARAGVAVAHRPLCLSDVDVAAMLPGPVALAARGTGAAPAVAAWLAVAAPRTVLLAAPRSFCAGVERAIEIVERSLVDGPVFVRKQIVHNTHVVAGLSARGATFVDELDEVPDGSTVVFSAHGVSPAVRSLADRRGLRVVDATCPLVAKVHVEARRAAARGDTIVLIGHSGHEEVEGTLGEAPASTVLVSTADDVDRLSVPDASRVSFLAQTTLAVDETAAVVSRLRSRFPEARGAAEEDICYATTNRQDAVRLIASDADLVLVVGSANSSNSRRLAELAARQGTRAELVDDVSDVRPEWLAGTRTVGLTAGASAPPGLVDDLVGALGGLGPVTVTERRAATETVRFALPPLREVTR
ncbi:4-hydroxy-3-methylbut-2-enyl diphosphate reductase [Virgisporangium aurantiacum]|uniref:4-hydroxy-3-methylbut-2-enyl diphosphate reductase n=1 Tax=Virgisporangium aurantiacum TaxID=175570 RepID=UPI001EF34A49|nr:4-hydroxy-3-methylbut-2-enyl diphosphate reductase [Virgisporangium aurantiacum]